MRLRIWIAVAAIAAILALLIGGFFSPGTEPEPLPKPVPEPGPEPAPEAPPAVVPEPPPPATPVEESPAAPREKPAPPPAGGNEATAVRGRVVDAAGGPVAFAPVFVPLSNGRTAASARTGEDGRFVIVVPADSSRRRIVVDTIGYLRASRPLGPILADAATPLEFVLDRGLTIVGVVTDDKGDPIETSLAAYPTGPSHDGHARLGAGRFASRPRTLARSDAAGRFEIGGLTEGQYVVHRATWNYLDGEGSRVTCDAGATGIEVVLYRAVSLKLQVRHAGSEIPVRDRIRWSLFLALDEVSRGETTNGEPVIRGLRAGKYQVFVNAPNYRPFAATVTLTLEEREATLAVPFVRTTGHGYGAIRGQVVRPEGSGQPLPRYEVSLAEFAWHRGYRPDVEGKFEIRDVPAGTYHLRATGVIHDMASRPVRTVVVAGETAEVTLRPEPGGKLVLDISGDESCREETLDIRLYLEDGILSERHRGPFGPGDYGLLRGTIHFRPVAPGPVRILAVARDRIVGEVKATVVAGVETVAKMTLLPTADGAPAAPEVAARVPVPSAEDRLPPPPAPPVDPLVPAAVAELTAKLSSDDQSIRFGAVRDLGKLGTGAIVRPLLHVLRNDPDYFVRRMAIRALGDLGREALSAVPDIAQAVVDKEPFVRDAATQAIAKIAGKALPYRKGMTKEEIAAAAKKLVEEVRGE